MNLRSFSFKEEYRSDEVNVVAEFYVPALTTSILYRRAVGYFTSNSITLAMQGIAALIGNGGKMRLIASPYLTKEDIEAIKQGYRTREEIVSAALDDQIPKNPNAIPDNNQWECLAWMIAHGSLDMKIAIPSKGDLPGLYHEKLGIFSDNDSNHVAFSGSANETTGGLVNNFETVDVFTSWSDSSRTERKIGNFERLWSNQTKRIDVIPFPDAVRAKILAHLPKRAPELPASQIVEVAPCFALPVAKPLRSYQEAAIGNWLRARGRGIMQMATGSGKTITGLAAAQRLYSSGNLEALVVVCPYVHLVTQWESECRTFNLEPILCFRSSDDWLPLLNSSLVVVGKSSSRPIAIITTTATFASQVFQSRIKHFPPKTLLLADEVHNMGADAIRSCLPESFGLRLGLSATPERWFDEEGTSALFNYFGGVLQPVFTLKDALERGALCKYSYHPILIPLTEDEAAEYRELSARIARLGFGSDDSSNSAVEALLIKRARLVATAEGKHAALESLISSRNGFSHHLFYCGDGSLEGDDGAMIKHVDKVTETLARKLGARVAKFTSENDAEERAALLKAFETGDLQGLVAIRCLDEGVDVPSTKTAIILASSTNPRQFIQRRGRILRLSPNKTVAEIFDMIVYPPFSDVVSESERSLAKKELLRYTEFAALAINAPEAKKALWKLQEHFHLTDI
ncbi:MAG: DEAD/DEAH box helicase family protein [Nibricoccus sp.]